MQYFGLEPFYQNFGSKFSKIWGPEILQKFHFEICAIIWMSKCLLIEEGSHQEFEKILNIELPLEPNHWQETKNWRRILLKYIPTKYPWKPIVTRSCASIEAQLLWYEVYLLTVMHKMTWTLWKSYSSFLQKFPGISSWFLVYLLVMLLYTFMCNFQQL